MNRRSFQPPRLPEVALRVMKLSRSEHCSASHLSELLRRDQFLAGEVLAAANTAWHGPRAAQRIASLERAVARLGIDNTRNIVMASALRQEVYRGPQRDVLERLWHKSVGTAFSLSLVAQLMRRHEDKAFVIGLLHDLGKPVLAWILDRVLEDFPHYVDYDKISGQVFHLMHARLGAIIVRRWQLGRNMSELVAHHHDRAPPKNVRVVAAMLRLATMIYEVTYEQGIPPGECDALLDHRLAKKLRIRRERLITVLSMYRGSVDSFMGE